MTSIPGLTTTSNVAYTYGADGSRVEKVYNGKVTEYVNFGGQTIAETDGTNWTDYVYANGRKIARATGAENVLTISGFNYGTGDYNWYPVNGNGGLGNYTVGEGDMLVLRQREHGAAIGGVQFDTTSGNGGVDQNGQPAATDRTGTEVWHQRVFYLSPQAGSTLQQLYVGATQDSGAGAWSIDFADMMLYSAASNSWIPIQTDTHPVSLSYWSGSFNGGYTTNATWTVGPVAATPGVSERYYTGDHLGTAQLEFASGGWPVWQGQFAAFGQELDSQSTANNYKFTGLEADSESGLDHATFRQYSPLSTRWMSADPYNGSMNPNNPQSFNRYSYVLNNPLVLRDPSGLECTGSDTFTVYADGSADDTGLVASCSFWDSVEAIAGDIGTGFADLGHDIKGLFVHHPSLKASRVPRPSAYDPDSARISALAQGINQGAGALNNPSTYVEWYGASAAIAGGYLAAPAVASWGANASGLLGPATGRVFWSAVGAPTAAAWAAANGGETLEMSPLGGFANWAQGYLPQNALTGAAWNALSSAFASGAQGGVTYLQGAWLGNTWLNTELPILLQNGNPISTVPIP